MGEAELTRFFLAPAATAVGRMVFHGLGIVLGLGCFKGFRTKFWTTGKSLYIFRDGVRVRYASQSSFTQSNAYIFLPSIYQVRGYKRTKFLLHPMTNF